MKTGMNSSHVEIMKKQVERMDLWMKSNPDPWKTQYRNEKQLLYEILQMVEKNVKG